MTNRIPVGIFFALFTVSGFAGLIYESIWSHYLKLFLGHAAYAQTLVLAIFMGGMAIGSWLVSRFTHRIRDLLLGYAIAELGIGLLAISFHAIFQGVTGWAFDSVLPALGGSGGVDLFKWTLASLLILPASILLGTTFPLMSGGIIRLYPDASGKALSMLYFTNSFGAAAGVLVSGFYLVDKVGLPGTILTAGLMNVALAFVVWVITKRLPAAAVAASDAASRPDRAELTLQRAVLILAFATGAASFIYEITWIRMLTMGLGASTHSFEVMLAAFILGMSLGALVLRFGINRVRSHTIWLAGLLVAKALFAVYAVWIYGDVLQFIYWVTTATARTDGGYALTTLSGLAASMMVMFPTAFCAGMTLPLATHALTSRGLGETVIGRVYGANTAGCIVGAAFTTHVGMEVLGVKNLTGLGALLDIAMAALIVLVTVVPALRMRALAVVAVVSIAAGFAFFQVELDKLRMASGVFRYAGFVDPDVAQLRYYRDGKTATISVYDVRGLRSIRTNGKPDASMTLGDRKAAADEGTMFLAGALPLSMKPGATDIANIGFGSGLTTHLLLGSPNVKVVDSIEIEPAMIEGAKWFAPRNLRAYEDPRSKLHIEDAKTFFAASGKRYDFIVSEPSNPWVSGVSTLFSEEFYGQVKRYLKDDGLLVQWVQVYEIDVRLLSTVFQALGKHFPDYVVYTPTQGDLIIIASPGPKIPPLTDAIYSFKGVADDIGYLGYRDLADLEALRVGGRAALEPLFTNTGYPANSDYFPILDQRAPVARFKRASADELRTLREYEIPLVAMLDGEARTPLARLASVDRNRPLRLDRALPAAEAVGVFTTGSASRAVWLPEAMQLKAFVASSLLQGCASSAQLWLGSIRDLAHVTSPYLEAKETAVIYEKIRSSPCWNSLDEAGRTRIALYEAVGRRDAEAMSRHGSALLALSDAQLNRERGYYVLAAMTGHLARGERQLAAAVWQRHGASLPEEIRSLLIARLALAHAGVSQASMK